VEIQSLNDELKKSIVKKFKFNDSIQKISEVLEKGSQKCAGRENRWNIGTFIN
jgi:hypothetical protein